jgi:hypothetical protein
VRNDTILNMVKRISQLNEKSIHGCVFNIKQSGLSPPQIAQLLTKHYHNYLCLKYQGELLNELPQYFSNVLKIFDRLRTAKNNALNIEYQRIVNGVSNVQPRQIHCIHDDDLQGHLFQPVTETIPDFYVQETTDELGDLRNFYNVCLIKAAAIVLYNQNKSNPKHLRLVKNEGDKTVNRIVNDSAFQETVEEIIQRVGYLYNKSDDEIITMLDYFKTDAFEYDIPIRNYLTDAIQIANEKLSKISK